MDGFKSYIHLVVQHIVGRYLKYYTSGSKFLYSIQVWQGENLLQWDNIKVCLNSLTNQPGESFKQTNSRVEKLQIVEHQKVLAWGYTAIWLHMYSNRLFLWKLRRVSSITQ